MHAQRGQETEIETKLNIHKISKKKLGTRVEAEDSLVYSNKNKGVINYTHKIYKFILLGG